VVDNPQFGWNAPRDRVPKARLIARVVPPALAPGGYVMSDLPLDLPAAFASHPLPPGAQDGSYHLYRRVA
jgi:hypothetical protein